MRLRLLALLPLLLLSACGGEDSVAPPPAPTRYQATASQLLSTASPTKDEDLSSYPAALIVNTGVGAGYSHRVTRTTEGGLYFGAWVQGTDPTQDIYYRFYQD